MALNIECNEWEVSLKLEVLKVGMARMNVERLCPSNKSLKLTAMERVLHSSAWKLGWLSARQLISALGILKYESC